MRKNARKELVPSGHTYPVGGRGQNFYSISVLNMTFFKIHNFMWDDIKNFKYASGLYLSPNEPPIMLFWHFFRDNFPLTAIFNKSLHLVQIGIA
jgi:hypothetical protein